jgi:hypothetical protein
MECRRALLYLATNLAITTRSVLAPVMLTESELTPKDLATRWNPRLTPLSDSQVRHIIA